MAVPLQYFWCFPTQKSGERIRHSVGWKSVIQKSGERICHSAVGKSATVEWGTNPQFSRGKVWHSKEWESIHNTAGVKYTILYTGKAATILQGENVCTTRNSPHQFPTSFREMEDYPFSYTARIPAAFFCHRIFFVEWNKSTTSSLIMTPQFFGVNKRLRSSVNRKPQESATTVH